MTSALADLTEREWQKQVVDLARMLGWPFIYHTHDSRKSARGFPDLVMVRERMVALELKSERGKLAPEQKLWIDGLLSAGVECYVVRPSDLDALAKVLALRVEAGVWGAAQDKHPGVWDALTSLRERTREECGA